MKNRLALLLLLFTFFLSAQDLSYDDLVFDEDSSKTVFKPSGKNFVFLKSKKGSGGMDKTPEADALLKAEIVEIILVFTESSKSALARREDNNRARWDNLIATYPTFFQDETNYKNFCQCDWSGGGDSEALKELQGFFIYYKDKATKKAEAAAKPVETKKEEIAVNTKKEEPKKESKPAKEPKPPKEPKVKETKKEEVAVVEEPEPYQPPVFKKRDGYSTPKRSKDVKACRPPFYGTGDEDLVNFFKDNITLSKKQLKHVKSDASVLKLQLNFDGSIKKSFITGPNAELNEIITVAIKNMDLWYPAVKAGVTVKSEVKMTLKYDKGTKAIRPTDIMIIPKPTPKCDKCLSDAEIFGAD